jgi:hypothetical protein
MWMRSCAVCKVLLRKLRLTDSIPLSVRVGVAGTLNLLGKAAVSRRTNDQEADLWQK